MREILFRGKRKDNGEWVYGGIVHQTNFYGDKVDNYFIIDGTTTEDNNIGYSYEVIHETIGQFTGTKDRNGIMIFEGDIVRGCWNDWNEDVKIYYDECRLQFRAKKGLLDYPIDYFRGNGNLLIIGNIHDNPELLEAV